MQEALRADIAQLTETFVGSTGLKASTVLSRAANDARFLERTGAGGKTFTVRVYENALKWFSENWPEGATWPADIKRPQAAPAPAPEPAQ